MTGTLLLLTGDRGRGKTTLCQTLAEIKKNEGYRVAGLISPPRTESGEKTGILALDLHTGESHLLASRIPGEVTGISYGQWVFDPAVFEWGNRVLLQSTSADITFIDEVGPLEINLGIGWTNAMDILAQGDFSICLTVVRPEYIPYAQAHWQPACTFNVYDGIEKITAAIIASLP
jgi:nucleoside-triphosphatase THEP1